MRVYAASAADAPLLVLGHGAGAGHDHPWMRHVAQGLAARGVHVVTFDFPYKAAKKSVPDPPAVLEAAFAKVWAEAPGAVAAEAAGPAPTRLFAGGKSMGGRIASQSAARGLFTPKADGLVFFGYPLHPPGKPQQRRDAHLPSVGAPMLFFHGTRDPFGTPEEMTRLVAGLEGATLELVEGGDHSLARTAAQERKSRAIEPVLDRAASWMSGGGRRSPS
jgi:predicted alpha/beta-hydrolase family hydrolase